VFGLFVGQFTTVWRDYGIISARNDRYQVGPFEHLDYGHTSDFIGVFILKIGQFNEKILKDEC
jgi:hypothetical protein